ncbi:MAG: rhodanese-like domain-containing protein [Melioribacteraceae bacterium]|nr:rhodanese-like domain-containing protein [Melioribacteraceae bacterium]
MGLLDLLFGDKSTLLKEALSKNGSIIDVRTTEEFRSGSIKGSINIPMDKISSSQKKISKMRQPIIVCCASGSRSASAKMMLKSSGISEVLNGGSWGKVDRLKSEL